MNISTSLRHATLVTSLLGGLTVPSRSVVSQEAPLPPRPAPVAPHDVDTMSPAERTRLSPYLAELPPKQLRAPFAQTLIDKQYMSPTRTGIALSRHHLFFVSWDERGILLDKSVLRSPRASHSAVIALASKVEASENTDGEVTHHLKQKVTVISFLPSSAQRIREKVRIDPFTLMDPIGTHGQNWQGLDFLLRPNAYLGGTPITTSVSHPIPVSETAYWAVVRRAEELDRQRKPYHVLASSGLREGTENCITGVAGVVAHLPNAPEPPFTGSLRGQEATDVLARVILEAAKVPTDGHGRYETGHDIWMAHEFLRATPSAQSGIRWYTLRKW